MINALPSDKSQSSGSLPAMPKMDTPESVDPLTNPSPTADITTPSPVADTSAPLNSPIDAVTSVHFPDSGLEINSPGAKPHGDVDHLSQKLSAKIGADADQSSVSKAADPTGLPSEVVPPAPPPNHPDKSLDSKSKFQMPMKFNAKGLVAALILGLVIAGGGAGYYLFQQNQDIRQQAASEEVINTESSRTPTEWGVFNQQWNDVLSNQNNSWQDYVAYAQSTGARYQCDAQIMTVGDETLYGCDLNALFILYEPEVYISSKQISPQDPALNRVLDGLITNSGILQESQKMGLVELDESIFNSNSKDTIKRLATIKDLREQLGSQFDKTVDFEAVAIYFRNQVDPKIPIAEAQTAAKAKMDILYQRLNSSEITMAQAGQEIATDSIKGDTTGVSLTNLDPLYKENAYIKQIAHKFDGRFFKDETQDEELRSLGEGQISTVRLCKDYVFTDEDLLSSISSKSDFNPPLEDSCYMIFKVNKINFGIIPEDSDKASAEDVIEESYQQQTTKHLENL